MADNPYTPPTLSGFNSNPPSDDGSQVSANEIQWAKHIDKIGTPLKTFAEAIDSAVSSAFGQTINTGADQENSMSGSLAFASSELTITAGAITATRSHHTVDTQSDASTDDLDTMSTASISDGGIVILRAENAGRTVVVKHEAGGAGQFHLRGALDFSLDDSAKTLIVQRRGADWYEVPNHPEATPPFSKEFESAEQTITSAGALTLAHELAAEPKIVETLLICKIAEANYSVDDKVFVAGNMTSGTGGRGTSIVPDSTNLNIRYGSNTSVFETVNKTTGASINLTNSNWRAIFRAYA